MDPLLMLTHLTLILLLGLLSSIIAHKLKIPNILLLVLAGLFLGHLRYMGEQLINMPPLFLTSVGVLALVMIVFDSTSRFKLKEFDSVSWNAMKLSVIFLLLSVLILTFFAYKFFNLGSVLYAVIFSILMSGTDPSAVLTIFKDEVDKVGTMLKIESIINTPLVVILPFIVLDIQNELTTGGVFAIDTIINNLSPFLLKFIVGIGTGVLVGIILLKIMKKNYSDQLSPLSLMIAALLTYIIAENLQGSGVLAVTTLGLLFGNAYVRERVQLQEFSALLSLSLQILVFVLVGIIIKLPLEWMFYIKSGLLFVIYLFIRYLAIIISFKKGTFNFKEKIFMTLNASKGIAVAVMTFTLASMLVGDALAVLDLVLVFLLYSIILSTIVVKFSDFFLKVPQEPSGGLRDESQELPE